MKCTHVTWWPHPASGRSCTSDDSSARPIHRGQEVSAAASSERYDATSMSIELMRLLEGQVTQVEVEGVESGLSGTSFVAVHQILQYVGSVNAVVGSAFAREFQDPSTFA